MVKTIPKQVLQGLKSIADETIEQGSDEVKKVVGISMEKPVDLVPDIADLNDEQKRMLENNDGKKTSQQTEEIRQALGRDVGREMEMISKEKENEEEEKETQLLENLKRQRQAEEEERQRLLGEDQTPAHRKKKSRGSAFSRGKKPAASDMSATSEFYKKKD